LVGHKCELCDGKGGIPCEHGSILEHDYCEHKVDDSDHLWHYTRQ